MRICNKNVGYFFRAAGDDSKDNFTDGKKTKGKKSRKKHNDESVSSEPKVVIKEEDETYIEIKSSLKKKINRIEPDSDNDTHKKNKIMSLLTNGDQHDSQDSISYDESYLNLKVKQEESASYLKKHKKKKRKHESIDSSTNPLSQENDLSSEINHDNVTSIEEIENNAEINETKKKKKNKSKKHYGADDLPQDIEEKMDFEETVVKKNCKGNHTHSFVKENTTFQEESDLSGCDEISAIKCDDSHSPHAISFINKSIGHANTKVNCNDNLNISNKQAGNVTEPDFNKKLEATELRKQRISDRIRFEDDDDDDHTNTEPSHVEHESHSDSNAKLKHFLNTNPNLKLLSQKITNKTNLTRDDEIWILKCPREINIKDFESTALNINGKCKIKIGGQTYEGSAGEEQSETIPLLIMEQNKYKIRNFPLNGIINLRKRIPKAHFRDDNIMVNNQTNFIPLPDTKCRHPLFGTNYKKALKIPTAIAERLNVKDTEDNMIRTAKRKKKKNKKDNHTSEQVDPQSDVTMKTEPELSDMREKKIKKRKNIDDEGPAPKKMKRIKHDPESAEVWESEQAIEENLFNF